MVSTAAKVYFVGSPSFIVPSLSTTGPIFDTSGLPLSRPGTPPSTYVRGCKWFCETWKWQVSAKLTWRRGSWAGSVAGIWRALSRTLFPRLVAPNARSACGVKIKLTNLACEVSGGRDRAFMVTMTQQGSRVSKPRSLARAFRHKPPSPWP